MLSSQLDVLPHLATFVIVSVVIYAGVRTVYNFYFHPLRSIPGPRLAAISNISYSYSFLSGRHPYNLLELHNKYGPVVRTAPNEVSFNTAQSWKDIYGRRNDGKVLIKGEFYAGGSYAGIGTTSIVSERNPHVHREMRSYLAGAFSERSLSEQEGLITDSIEKFMRLLDARSSATTPAGASAGFNLVELFEMLTFDITGDLAFGQNFGCLDNDLHHPWISIALGALRQGALVDTFNRFPVVSKFLTLIFQKKIKALTEDTRRNEALALEAVRRRMSDKSPDRKDFLAQILPATPHDPRAASVSDTQVAAHASDLVIAGADTAATALSTCMYYLLRTPRVLAALQAEIRGEGQGDGDGGRGGRFRSCADLTFHATAELEYLHAVLLEGMRMFPPLPMGLPRVVPTGGAVVDGRALPEGINVSTSPLAASLSASNFHDPLEFRPERWLGKNELDTRTASQPFSLGSRACIGRSLAWMEMRTTLARVVWAYDFELVDHSLDWHRDSQMHTLWKKPRLMVRAFPRSIGVRA